MVASKAVKKTQENATSSQSEEHEALALTIETDIYREDAGLTAQQWQAVALLVAGTKQLDVASALGVTQETVSRWRHSPVFVAALNAGIRDSYVSVIGEVRDASTDAIRVLRETMQSEDERLRLMAALATLRLRVQLDVTALTLPTSPADLARESLRRRQFNELDDVILRL